MKELGSSLLLPQKERSAVWSRKKRVIVLAGPTASGKTELSLCLAQGIGGEVISADSMQVYRGRDIGTSKASAEERTLIAHHMIDICDLEYDVASVGATEPSHAEENQAAFYLVHYRLPEQK